MSYDYDSDETREKEQLLPRGDDLRGLLSSICRAGFYAMSTISGLRLSLSCLAEFHRHHLTGFRSCHRLPGIQLLSASSLWPFKPPPQIRRALGSLILFGTQTLGRTVLPCYYHSNITLHRVVRHRGRLASEGKSPLFSFFHSCILSSP